MSQIKIEEFVVNALKERDAFLAPMREHIEGLLKAIAVNPNSFSFNPTTQTFSFSVGYVMPNDKIHWFNFTIRPTAIASFAFGEWGWYLNSANTCEESCYKPLNNIPNHYHLTLQGNRNPFSLKDITEDGYSEKLAIAIAECIAANV